jgi:hypothetical protein
MRASETRRELGRVSAGLLGGFVLALAIAMALSIYYPHPNAINRLFAGGILFGPLWMVAMLFAFMTRDGRRAWLCIGLPAIGAILLNVLGFLAIP